MRLGLARKALCTGRVMYKPHSRRRTCMYAYIGISEYRDHSRACDSNVNNIQEGKLIYKLGGLLI